jgi:hypothetical protein
MKQIERFIAAVLAKACHAGLKSEVCRHLGLALRMMFNCMWSVLAFSCAFLSLVLWCLLMQSHSWLRHYATSWNVPGSIPDEVIGFFF